METAVREGTPATAVARARSRETWAKKINRSCNRAVDSIVQIGRDLAAAEVDLSKKEYAAMIEEDLSLSRKVADGLKAIAAHPEISKIKSEDLPASWSILHRLSMLSATNFRWAKKHDLIRADTSFREATAINASVSTNDGEIVRSGKRGSLEQLPNPAEANRLARAANKAVAASDGNIYFGRTDAEATVIRSERAEHYEIIDGIGNICRVAEKASPSVFLEDFPTFRKRQLKKGDIDTAIKWLASLYEEY